MQARRISSYVFIVCDHQKQHCYCRVLEQLVNVWAYDSTRKMVYIILYSSAWEEQHSKRIYVGKVLQHDIVEEYG
ncbi:hypothetical protein RDI58_010497 [Solanum bulbocastanum]|uniref:Uncharacterized protein n=1 Tax=Solanum bulbocastanum TaxID=147425 RepID=A0AAN8TTM7_SOLBU